MKKATIFLVLIISIIHATSIEDVKTSNILSYQATRVKLNVWIRYPSFDYEAVFIVSNDDGSIYQAVKKSDSNEVSVYFEDKGEDDFKRIKNRTSEKTDNYHWKCLIQNVPVAQGQFSMKERYLKDTLHYEINLQE